MTTDSRIADMARIAGRLGPVARRVVLACDTERRAGELGWITSNSTVQMRMVNHDALLIGRVYRAGCYRYHLTELGAQVRQYLETNR
jgi:hypothetical protein